MSQDLPALRRRAEADPQNREAALELARALRQTGDLAAADRLLFERGLCDEVLGREVASRLAADQRPIIEELRRHGLKLASRLKIRTGGHRAGSLTDVRRWLWHEPAAFLKEEQPARALAFQGIPKSQMPARVYALLARLGSLRSFAQFESDLLPEPEGFAEIRGLETAAFSQAQLSPGWLEALAALPALESIQTRSCRIAAPAAGVVFSTLRRYASAYRYIEAPWGSSARRGGASTIAPLFERPEALPALRRVRLENEDLTPALFEKLGRLPALEELSIHSGTIERGWTRLLSDCPRLRSLELEFCTVFEGASRDWTELRSLERLSLASSNKLGLRPGETADKASFLQVREALSALKDLPALRELELSGIRQVSAALPELPSLIALKLRSWRLAPGGLGVIGERFPALRHLDLRNTGIREAQARTVLPGIAELLTGG